MSHVRRLGPGIHAVECSACGRTRPRTALSPDNVCLGGCEHDDDLGQESPQMVNGQQVGP